MASRDHSLVVMRGLLTEVAPLVAEHRVCFVWAQYNYCAWTSLPRGLWNLSSLTRDRTCVPSIGRRILNHRTTRKVLGLIFIRKKKTFVYCHEQQNKTQSPALWTQHCNSVYIGDLVNAISLFFTEYLKVAERVDFESSHHKKKNLVTVWWRMWTRMTVVSILQYIHVSRFYVAYPRTEEPGRLQSMVLQGIGHNWVIKCTHIHTHP